MKRLVLIAALLAATAVGAQADNDIYRNTLKQPRSDAELQVDTTSCDQRYGSTQERRGDLAPIQALHGNLRMALPENRADPSAEDLDRP